MDWIDTEIANEVNNQLNIIAQKAREILKESIQKEVYDRYTPHGINHYIRTYQLLNSVNVEIKENNLIVFIDSDLLNYVSAVDDRNVSGAVPKFLRGHDDSSDINNWYHHYPKSNYLEEAKRRIENELGLMCEIIDDQPPRV